MGKQRVSRSFILLLYSDSIGYVIRSALNVVEAYATAESVKRLVFTSSVSAIICGRTTGNHGDGEILDEKCWTNLEFCREKKASLFTLIILYLNLFCPKLQENSGK